MSRHPHTSTSSPAPYSDRVAARLRALIREAGTDVYALAISAKRAHITYARKLEPKGRPGWDRKLSTTDVDEILDLLGLSADSLEAPVIGAVERFALEHITTTAGRRDALMAKLLELEHARSKLEARRVVDDLIAQGLASMRTPDHLVANTAI